MTRTIANIAGVLLTLLGALWIGQGLGHIEGSFMTGAPEWALIGAISAGLGVGILVCANFRKWIAR